MKNLLLTLVFAACTIQAKAGDSLAVMFWNLENFFDTVDEGKNKGEKDFSATGTRYWTKNRFFSKCNAIAKSVLWIQDRYGRLPDVIGVAEIENAKVLNTLLNATALKKKDYKTVHYDSDDPRGIDVALLYRASKFEKTASKAYKVIGKDGIPIRTRDILYVCLKERQDGRNRHYIVNHHPSKFSGSKASATARECAMKTLKSICDSLHALGETHIVAMGDFNDTPDNEAFRILDSTMVNLAVPLAKKGYGTIRYQGRWDLIDMFIVSGQVAESSRMEIVRIPFLMQDDRAHPGEKPFRTYSGPRYIGGISDHCPIILLFYQQDLVSLEDFVTKCRSYRFYRHNNSTHNKNT